MSIRSISDYSSKLERIEEETEGLETKRTELQSREAVLLEAVSKLETDVQIQKNIELSEKEVRKEIEENEILFSEYRSKVEELKGDLLSLKEELNHSKSIICELQDLGEDVQDSLLILENRKELVEQCEERLQKVIERLGLSSFSDQNYSDGDAISGEEVKRETATENYRESIKELAEKGFYRGQDMFPKMDIKDEASSSYWKKIAQRHRNTPAQFLKLFSYYSSQIVLQDLHYPADQTPHYQLYNELGHPRGVYLHATVDSFNLSGAGSTFYHEVGHMIDHAATGFNGLFSNRESFKNALLYDGERIRKIVGKMNPEEYKRFERFIYSDIAASCSDILEATTGSQMHGKYGHGEAYWKEEGHIQAEAFAHFFEASMGEPKKLGYLKTLFPTAYTEFQSIISDMSIPISSAKPTKDERVRELVRREDDDAR